MPIKLGFDQLTFIARFVEHFIPVLDMRRRGEQPVQRVFLLMGQGGTGKSEIIKVCTGLCEHFYDVLTRTNNGLTKGVGPVLKLMASQNAAASRIGGDTIHSTMHFATNEKYCSVEGLGNRKVDAADVTEWQDVHMLALDELSMVSPKMKASVSYRLCQVRKRTWGASPNLFTQRGEAFGRIPIVLLIGDFMQLPAFEGAFYKVSLLGELKRKMVHGGRSARGQQPSNAGMMTLSSCSSKGAISLKMLQPRFMS